MAILIFAGRGPTFAQARLAAENIHPPRSVELIEIIHCLTSEKLNWLGDRAPALEKARKFHVGLRHDRTTYPGENVVFVAIFASNSKGDVFELTRKDHGNHRTYNLENNGSFRLGLRQVEWPNEIFGGVWTHEYVQRNIRILSRGPKTWVSKAAVKPIRPVSCSYYGQAGNDE